jgi:SAM-dependent methyltransferase
MRGRPDVSIIGLELQVRDDCAIVSKAFDGNRIPFDDGYFDYVSFVDVLHHTDDPMVLLKEALRVSRYGLIIKDHLKDGFLAGLTLDMMDWVGNRRYGIRLTQNYWTRGRWEKAFEELEVIPYQWRKELKIYPLFIDYFLGRGLHFFATLHKQSKVVIDGEDDLEYWHPGLVCCNERWESAYRKFETSDEEKEKFRKRFIRLGIDKLPRDSVIVDLFCGRGNGLAVLKEWGFTDLTGVDLSPDLLRLCPNGIRRVVADCTELRFASGTVDVFIVQGGLHHLPCLEETLPKCLSGIHDALKSSGRFVVVEPCNTLFLRLIHFGTRLSWVRNWFPKADAFATMVEEEMTTYVAWLAQPRWIIQSFRNSFGKLRVMKRWGKFFIIAQKEGS